MKKALIFLFMCLPMMTVAQTTLTPEQKLEQAQRQLEEAKAALEQAKINAAKAKAAADEKTKGETSDSWVVPSTSVIDSSKTDKHLKTDSKAHNDFYLQKGVVPEINGQVVWSDIVVVPGANAEELYNKAFAYLTELTQSANQLNGSKVALVNKSEHSIVATVREKLIFSSSFLSLDYTQFNYVLQATCRDGQATLTMKRLTYRYDVQGNVSEFSAEKWITDKYALNKKQTRLLPISGKFRRATIDRKNSIFEGFMKALSQQ
ncbi:DUF4468 domain-containing protein [Prevotella sp.]